MNKTELVAAMAKETNLSKKDVEDVLKSFVDVVSKELKNGGKIQLVGFGTFEVSERAAREGRNPQTGETMKIEASKAPKFKAGKALKDMTADDLFDVVEQHAKDGVDFMTIHAGINQEVAGHILRNKRITNLVSRGGSILFAWMYIKGKENPFYEQFDRLLEICKAYDVTISLGDACRSGCGHDSTDAVQISELIILGELVLRAREAGVQIMVEGPGHMPIHDIRMNVEIAKKLCHGAPLYVLGPIVTDVAPGYDHITAAIGGALSASCGADFLCYVTPAEHLRLPDLSDVREGIVSSKIACHAADLAKKVKDAHVWDEQMSWARRDVDFSRMIPLALDPEKANAYRQSSLPEEEKTCTMCGPKCPMKTLNEILNNHNSEKEFFDKK